MRHVLEAVAHSTTTCTSVQAADSVDRSGLPRYSRSQHCTNKLSLMSDSRRGIVLREMWRHHAAHRLQSCSCTREEADASYSHIRRREASPSSPRSTPFVQCTLFPGLPRSQGTLAQALLKPLQPAWLQVLLCGARLLVPAWLGLHSVPLAPERMACIHAS